MEVMQDIFDIMRANTYLKSLVQCVKVTGLENKLNRPGFFYTVFAPSETAFNNLHEVELEGWLKAESKIKLLNILYNHIIEGQFSIDDLLMRRKFRTINGKILQIEKLNNSVSINNAPVKEQGKTASNGIVYLVDKIFTS
jgi:uncharacterized surface protein with fasciclin (FAS1) repeats